MVRALVVIGPLAAGQKFGKQFQSKGHHVEYAETGQDALSIVRRCEFDVVLIALSLPDMRGSDLIQRLRSARVNAPVMALSSTPHAEPKVAALNAGADDVMTLPFDEAELEARVQAMVRRRHGHSHQVLTAGPLSINLDTHEVAIDGRGVILTAKETAVIELLMIRSDALVTKETFLNQLYTDVDQHPDLRVIDVFICRIRKKLAAVGALHVIETVRGRGYLVRTQPRVSVADPGPSEATASTGTVSEMA